MVAPQILVLIVGVRILLGEIAEREFSFFFDDFCILMRKPAQFFPPSLAVLVVNHLVPSSIG